MKDILESLKEKERQKQLLKLQELLWLMSLLEPQPQVIVTVTPSEATIKPGGTLQFSAELNIDIEQDFTWSVSGNSGADTVIDEDGFLTVDIDEPVGVLLTVTADFFGNPAIRGTAIVTVIAPDVIPYIQIMIHDQPIALTNVTQGNIAGSSLNVTATAIFMVAVPGIAMPILPTSYQWYTNTVNSNAGGTPIIGATDASFTIQTNLTAGDYYFFCEISATGATLYYPNITNSVRSDVAVVNVNCDHTFQWTASIVWGMETEICNDCTETRGSRLATNMMAPIPAGSVALSASYTANLSAFHMGKYEVTQAQYEAIMGVNPSHFLTDITTGEDQNKRPVERVSWYDTIVFCNRLSILEGLSPAYRIPGYNNSTNPDDWGSVPTSSNEVWNAVEVVPGSNGYRLPTEAQWEYACRAGTTSTYYWGEATNTATVGQYAWFDENANSKTHEVGRKLPNAWGLYDMSGNVFEWCWDRYGTYPTGTQTDPVGASSESGRIHRGGSWYYSVEYLLSAFRNINPDLGLRLSDLGFRVARP